jgi:hypothetical protein
MPFGDADSLNLKTGPQLALARCPHCSTANPTLVRRVNFAVQPGKAAYADQIQVQIFRWLQWHVYSCESCGGLVAAGIVVEHSQMNAAVTGVAKWLVPGVQAISTDIPPRAANYLKQARETVSSPAASVVMSASAVDAMLKERTYKDGSLYSRIQKAEEDGVLTEHMAAWAHDIRLDANDERHADTAAIDATPADAARCLEFADALADLLFVLPARVKRGRKSEGK